MEKAEKQNGHLWKVEKVSKLTTSPVVRVNPGGGCGWGGDFILAPVLTDVEIARGRLMIMDGSG